MSISIKKPVLALLSALTLLVSSLAGVSPASAAPQTMANVNSSVSRTIQQDGTVKLAPGKSLYLRATFNSNSFVSDGVKVLANTFAVTPQANLQIDSNPNYYWRIDGCPQPNTYFTATKAPCAASTGFYTSVEYKVTNTAGTVLNVATNISSASVTYGGIPVDGSFSLSPSTRFDSGMLTTSMPFDATNGDNHVTLSVFICFDSALVAQGDSLSVTKTETFNGNAVTDNRNWTIGYGNTTFGDTLTYDSGAYGVGSTLVMASYNGLVTDGSLSVSFDITKNGTSVLKSCSSNNPGPNMNYVFPGIVELGSVEGSAGSPIPSAPASKTLLNGAIENSMADNVISVDDGNGNYLYEGPATGDVNKTVITRLTPKGADTTFGTSGKITFSTGTQSKMAFGWYGAKANVALITFDTTLQTPVYKIHSSTMKKNAKPIVKSITGIDKACGTGWTARGIRKLFSVQSSSPMALLYCYKNPQYKQVVISINPANGAAKAKLALGVPATGDCQFSFSGKNSEAKGSAAAIILYVKSSPCLGNPMTPTVSTRAIATITAAGVGKLKSVTANPWATEPSYMDMVPGFKANTWIGSGVAVGSMSSSDVAPFTVDAAGKIIQSTHLIVDSTVRDDFGLTGNYRVIKAISATKWLVMRNGYADMKQLVALAVVNTATGTASTGKAIQFTPDGSGNPWNDRNIIDVAYRGTKANFYAVTSPSAYVVSSWTLPTK